MLVEDSSLPGSVKFDRRSGFRMRQDKIEGTEGNLLPITSDSVMVLELFSSAPGRFLRTSESLRGTVESLPIDDNSEGPQLGHGQCVLVQGLMDV